MAFTIIRQDLSRVRADAIVVPANPGLQITGGTVMAVAKAAGRRRLQRACNRLGGCPVGQAVATPAFKLPAEHIIHAVGPIWRGGDAGEPELLRSAYDSALQLALRLNAQSVALPLLSTGSFGYPMRPAFEIAMAAIRAFLETADMDVLLAVYDKRAVVEGSRLFGEIAEFIDDATVERHLHERRNRLRDVSLDGYLGDSYGAPLLDHAEPGATGSLGAPLKAPGEGKAEWPSQPDLQMAADAATLESNRADAGLRYCPRCGHKVAGQARFCPFCGSLLDEGWGSGDMRAAGTPGNWDFDGAVDAADLREEDFAASSQAMPQYSAPTMNAAPTPAPAAGKPGGHLHLPQSKGARRPSSQGSLPMQAIEREPAATPPELGDLIANMDEGFSLLLMHLIDARGMSDAEVYKRANITRQHFSKIRRPDYKPTKKTVVALAIALRLTLPETVELLARAGFALSHSDKFDIIVEYFISHGDYDIFRINEALFAYDQQLLG